MHDHPDSNTGPGAQSAPASGIAPPIAPANAAPPLVATESAIAEIIRIAVPSVATTLSYTLMQFVDAYMVSLINPEDPIFLAAQGNGGISAWTPQAIMAGMLGVVNTYVAQHLGAGQLRKGPAYAWNGLWLCLALWLLMLPYALALPFMFRSFGHAPRLVELETSYAQILIAGAFIQMAGRCLSQFFYGLHRPNVVLVAAVAGNIVNLGLDYVLIFGHFGAPAMGISGAAIATVIGTAVELSIPACLFLGPAMHAKYGTRDGWRPSAEIMRKIIAIGWPGGMMFFNEMICWTYFLVKMTGSFGVEHNTAGWIALRYMHLSFMPSVGISNAMTSIVGRYLGMRRPDLAAHRAKIGLAIAMTYMALCAVVFVVFRRQLVGVFSTDEAIITIGSGVMIIAAVFQVFDALGITLIGVLRGAGDTVFPSIVTIIAVWICLIGGGLLLMKYAPEFESLGPWSAAAAYICIVGILLAIRFARGKWKTLRLAGVGEPVHV